MREPAVSGMFYPGDKSELEEMIDKFLDNVPKSTAEGELKCLVVPHAGYDYSGQVAAYAYKELIGQSYDSVIILGPSHRVYFDGVSVGKFDYYKTPLGKVMVDQDLAQRLIKADKKITFNRFAHEQEHSVEVQVPFLQKVHKNLKIVPIVYGDQSLDASSMMARAILDSIGNKKVLVIASSDFSHFYPYDKAKEMDEVALNAIESGNITLLAEMLSKKKCELCGYGPVFTTMMVANAVGASEIDVLKYANSGDVTGDKSRVVGYASIAFRKVEYSFTNEDKKKLLKIARETLDAYLIKGKTPDFKVAEGILTQRRGAFVTLTKNGKLRGCIGYIQPVKPLYQAVQEMAIAAATRDTRFPSITASELKDIKIEISALSPLQRIYDVNKIEVGKHGLYIIKGWASGLLLPQVATDLGWDREEFLENVCRKAMLPLNAWKDKDAELYIFSAEIFHEE